MRPDPRSGHRAGDSCQSGASNGPGRQAAVPGNTTAVLTAAAETA